MKRSLLGLLATVLISGAVACSSHDQEKAKDDAKRTATEIKQDAKDLAHKVDAAVKPDTEKASDKMSDGVQTIKDASSKAGDKLEQAALLAKVKTKLASDAGLSSLTKVDVSVDGSVVTLSGSVASEAQKKAAMDAVSQISGVSKVINGLVIAP